MLADIASVGFKVENFTRANMATLETNWAAIRNALVRTVELAASFDSMVKAARRQLSLCQSHTTFTSRQAPDNYVTHGQYAADREMIRQWLIRSLLKASGIWGSGLDTLLTALRGLIQTSNKDAFSN